ncbi:MAG: TRAP transporter large permease subunit [Desulfobacterales bacterium]|jgi:TRAP-type mannitol/chloroaromatic compound transport system permease large subunit|nr:TRAP transporter large permease subunit [Desulfobacterales bacterium]MCU0989856.1 TRAP transporter large permease subunit [Xanthomonadales bacterium]
MRKEVWFGLSIMALVVIGVFWMMPPPSQMTNGHLGLLMLAMIVIAIMLGFPTAFTLMGMGTMFTFFFYSSTDPSTAVTRTLDLMVQRAYAVMNNDVLISVPLFVFMGYLVERANLIERLFKSLHLATSRIPGSLAVATVVTCAVFATATGIIGAVVTLMGLLAFPAMLKAGYNIRLAAGAVTAGGTLGILIPPSVLLILYGATAGVSVVQLYAGAFFPGIMLATLYVLWITVNAKLRPGIAPPLSDEDQRVDLPRFAEIISRTRRNVMAGLIAALKGKRNAEVPLRTLVNHLVIALLPALAAALLMGSIYLALTAPDYVVPSELQEMGFAAQEEKAEGLEEPEEEAGGLQEPPVEGEQEAPPAAGAVSETPKASTAVEAGQPNAAEVAKGERKPVPTAYWVTLSIVAVGLAVFYAIFTFVRLEIFKMLLSSFFPLALLILGVLGSIVVGLATPTEAAAMGSFGGFVLAAAYRQLTFTRVKESVFLCAKTSAMVCWLFVGSAIFAAAFALLGGQEIINAWVKSLDMTPIQFMLLAQVIIFLLGWPLEWTEIIVIFMPIFIPLLAHFNIDPLFFGLLVALNLQTAFLSPPVAMAAFYLKGVAPPHVSLNQIFMGMMPYMAIQVLALLLLYLFPQIGLWLPSLVYQG